MAKKGGRTHQRRRTREGDKLARERDDEKQPKRPKPKYHQTVKDAMDDR